MKKKKEESPYAAIVADLFKNVRSKEEFNQIMTQLMKEGLETVLRAELDEHLDHDKNQPSEDGNTRNGFSKKTVKGSIGDIALSIRFPETEIVPLNLSLCLSISE